MAITVPVLALGIPIPNPTFARPDVATSGKAAGWTISGASLTEQAIFDDSPDRGHARVQQYTLGGGVTSGTILSAPAPPDMFCESVSSFLTGWVYIKTTGLSASSTLALKVQWYNSSGTALSTPATILTRTSDAADWTVYQSTISVTPGGSADHLRISLVITRGSGSTPIVVKIAFAGVGTYTTAAGYYTATRVLGSESHSRPTNKRSILVDSVGVRRVLGRDRYVSARNLYCRWPLVDNTERLVFDYLERMNFGRAWAGDTYNPSGGVWPLVIVTNLSGVPAIFMGDLMDEESGIAELEQGWRPDPPNWSVTFNLTERV